MQHLARMRKIHSIRRKEIELIFKEMNPRRDCTLLEVGCGDGFQSTLWASKVSLTVPTDVSTNRIEAKIPNFIRCSATHLPFRNRSFDIVYSSHVLEHIHARRDFLKEAERVSVKEGLIVTIVPSIFWKILQMLTYYMNFLYLAVVMLLIIHRSSSWNKRRNAFKEILASLVPRVHGVYNSNCEELLSYKKDSWINLLHTQGFSISKVITTFPFGALDFTIIPNASFLRKLGLSSSYVLMSTVIVDEGHTT